MNRTQQILGILVVVQVILAAVMLWPNNVEQNQGELLFGEINEEQLVAFSVDGELGESIAFNRTDDGWELANSDGYPANAEKIDPLLEKLVQIKTGRFVASDPNSFARLKVADTDFMRRIWVKDVEGNENILFIGSTVGTAATHVRRAGSNDVFLTDKVTPWEFGSEPRSWIDIVYLEIPREQMTSLTLENDSGVLSFINIGTSEEDNWVLEGLAAGEEFNPNNFISMATRLTNLQFTKPLGKTELTEYGFDNPSAVVTVNYQSEEAGTQTLILRIGALDPSDNHYFVHASNQDYYVKIPKYSLQDYVERSKEVFLQGEQTTE